MKIFCIGRNYAGHAREMNASLPTEPVIFIKPDGAVLRNNADFYLPDFSKDVHYECELFYRIGKPGKYVDPEFAWRYIDGIGLGIDFTARDLQQQLKAQGLPWEKSKGFHSSAPISKVLPLDGITDHRDIHFELKVNGEVRQHGHTADMIFDVPQMVHHISKYFLMKTGDLIFTGTPEGVGPVKAGDVLEGTLMGQQMFRFEIK